MLYAWNGQEDLLKQAIEMLGAERYLRKPIDISEPSAWTPGP